MVMVGELAWLVAAAAAKGRMVRVSVIDLGVGEPALRWAGTRMADCDRGTSSALPFVASLVVWFLQQRLLGWLLRPWFGLYTSFRINVERVQVMLQNLVHSRLARLLIRIA